MPWFNAQFEVESIRKGSFSAHVDSGIYRATVVFALTAIWNSTDEPINSGILDWQSATATRTFVHDLDKNGACGFDQWDHGKQFTDMNPSLCTYRNRTLASTQSRKYHVDNANCEESPRHVHSLNKNGICKYKYCTSV